MKNKFVITVVGRDTVGIIAKVCTYLADQQNFKISGLQGQTFLYGLKSGKNHSQQICHL